MGPAGRSTIIGNRIASALLAAALGAACAADVLAQTNEPQAILDFVTAYEDAEQVSGFAARLVDLDDTALQSQECEVLEKSRITSAEDVFREGRPPDPRRFIQKTSCYTDIANIRIPMLGGGFMSGIVDAVLRLLARGNCRGQIAFWTQITDALEDGDYAGIRDMAFAEQGPSIDVQMPEQLAAGQVQQWLGGDLFSRTSTVIQQITALTDPLAAGGAAGAGANGVNRFTGTVDPQNAGQPQDAAGQP